MEQGGRWVVDRRQLTKRNYRPADSGKLRASARGPTLSAADHNLKKVHAHTSLTRVARSSAPGTHIALTRVARSSALGTRTHTLEHKKELKPAMDFWQTN